MLELLIFAAVPPLGCSVVAALIELEQSSNRKDAFEAGMTTFCIAVLAQPIFAWCIVSLYGVWTLFSMDARTAWPAGFYFAWSLILAAATGGTIGGIVTAIRNHRASCDEQTNLVGVYLIRMAVAVKILFCSVAFVIVFGCIFRSALWLLSLPLMLFIEDMVGFYRAWLLWPASCATGSGFALVCGLHSHDLATSSPNLDATMPFPMSQPDNLPQPDPPIEAPSLSAPPRPVDKPPRISDYHGVRILRIDPDDWGDKNEREK